MLRRFALPSFLLALGSCLCLPALSADWSVSSMVATQAQPGLSGTLASSFQGQAAKTWELGNPNAQVTASIDARPRPTVTAAAQTSLSRYSLPGNYLGGAYDQAQVTTRFSYTMAVYGDRAGAVVPITFGGDFWDSLNAPELGATSHSLVIASDYGRIDITTGVRYNLVAANPSLGYASFSAGLQNGYDEASVTLTYGDQLIAINNMGAGDWNDERRLSDQGLVAARHLVAGHFEGVLSVQTDATGFAEVSVSMASFAGVSRGAASAALDPVFAVEPTYLLTHAATSLQVEGGVGNTAAVPEVSGAGLMPAGLMMLWLRRRRQYGTRLA